MNNAFKWCDQTKWGHQLSPKPTLIRQIGWKHFNSEQIILNFIWVKTQRNVTLFVISLAECLNVWEQREINIWLVVRKSEMYSLSCQQRQRKSWKALSTVFNASLFAANYVRRQTLETIVTEFCDKRLESLDFSAKRVLNVQFSVYISYSPLVPLTPKSG